MNTHGTVEMLQNLIILSREEKLSQSLEREKKSSVAS